VIVQYLIVEVLWALSILVGILLVRDLRPTFLLFRLLAGPEDLRLKQCLLGGALHGAIELYKVTTRAEDTTRLLKTEKPNKSFSAKKKVSVSITAHFWQTLLARVEGGHDRT